jgi:Na+/melibiose symporter-like transporter
VKETAKGKLNYKQTILTGFGFLATSIAWAIYDPYITKILKKFLTESHIVTEWSAKLANVSFLARFISSQGESAFVGGKFTLVPLFIGVIMTFDNIFGVIFQPLFGKISDQCHSRLGKRRPFILIGAPISAVLFALIPWMPSLPAVMVCIILFVFVMSLWRSPVVALMPDLTPPDLRSDGNAVINLMGGIGAAVGMGAGTVVTVLCAKAAGVETKALDEFLTFPYVFLTGAVVMVVGMLALLFFVKEKDSRLLSADLLADRDAAARKAAEQKAKAEERAARKGMKLTKAERFSLGMMLLGLFFLFCGVNAITTFFSLFAEEILHRETAGAARLILILFLCSALAALPSGKLGQKFGRKKTILAGLVMFLGAFLVFFGVFLGAIHAQGFTVSSYIALNAATPGAAEINSILGTLNVLIYPVLILAGFANMMITVNTLPLVLEIGGLSRVGTFTGYYYTATFSAQIASPIVYGFFRMFSGSYISLFYYSPIAFALALLVILFVRHGEAIPERVIREAKLAED